MARDSWLKRLIWLRGSPAGGSGASYEKTVGPASILSISDAKAKPAKSLIVGMEPIQAGSGDPSPDNIRPISGRTGLTAYRTGVNVWDEEWEIGGFNYTTGAPVDETNRIRSKYFCGCRPSTQYYWRIPNKNLRILYYDANKNYINHDGWYDSSRTITTPSNAVFFKIAGSVAYGTTYNNDIAVNYPATDTEYHAYTGQTYPVTWQDDAGTVYGGTVDVVSGVLTVDRAQIASYNGEALPGKWISDRDVYAEGTSPTTGAQVVYELATPQTYQLTPTQIQLLKGSNTLWSDGDSLTLTYLGTTPANLLGGGYNPPAEQDPEELTEPEATETDEPTKETPAEEGENNGE